jgi:3-hydroxy-3-methylglutaryl CoA synthase
MVTGLDEEMRVGIDDLNLAAGRRCIDFVQLVESGRHTASALADVGFWRRSVLNVWEDPVTLATEAAEPLVDDPNQIGLMLVGTETGVDYGKPLSSYLHRTLGLGPHCRNAEIKHACYGSTMALRLACDWVREHRTEKALVISTDICRPHDGTAAELTAGVGAVAMVVCAEPRVLDIDPASGCAAQEVWDVARPTRTREHQDPILSICAYLDALEGAWNDLASSTQLPLKDLRYILYHCPLISLVRQAHMMLTGSPRDFQERVEPTLGLNRELGNIYGGSLYASLIGLVEARDLEEGTPIGLFSYGSGACGEFFTGRVGPSATYLRRHHVTSRIASRQPCAVSEWLKAEEALQAQLQASDLEIVSPANAGPLVLERIKEWHRTYRWAA